MFGYPLLSIQIPVALRLDARCVPVNIPLQSKKRLPDGCRKPLWCKFSYLCHNMCTGMFSQP